MALITVTSDVGLKASLITCEDTLEQSQLVLQKVIGNCMSGSVFRAHIKGDIRQKRAAKFYDKVEEREKGVNYKKYFLREVAVLQFVNHKHIVSDVLAYESDEFRIISMPFYPGGTLQSHLKTLTTERTRKYFKHISSAVHHLHLRGLVHRDVKPSNVVINDQDEAVLIDLGLAKLYDGPTTKARITGTKGYMAPEVGVTTQLDLFKCDAYSLGATLWTMLFQTQHPPTKGCLHCMEYDRLPNLYRLLFFRLCDHRVESRWNVFDMVYRTRYDLDLRELLAHANWD